MEETRLNTSWWAEDDAEDSYWVPYLCDDFSPNREPSSMAPVSNFAVSSSSDGSILSRVHGIQSSWTAPVEPEGFGAQDNSSNNNNSRSQSSASKSHSMAEKRRRDRINGQLSSLRKLIPQSDNMDKAALLGSVIDKVKDLKRKASEISKVSLVPTETDEVNIDLEVPKTSNSKSSAVLIRASVCCDDRPELFGELVRVTKGMRLTTVKADMTSIGGRIRSILVLCSEEGEDGGFSVSSLKQSLRVVVSRIAASASVSTNYRSIRSKRQRFFSH